MVCGVALPSDVCWDTQKESLLTCSELDSRISEECYAMASFALLEANLKIFKASDIACAILYFVRRALGVVPIWTNEHTMLVRTDPGSDSVTNVLSIFQSLLLSNSSHSSPSSPSSSSGQEKSSKNKNSTYPSGTDSDVRTPVQSKNRETNETNDVDNLSALISNTTITVQTQNENPNPVWQEGLSTPEDKENMNKHLKDSQLQISPVSVIAMDNLDLAV